MFTTGFLLSFFGQKNGLTYSFRPTLKRLQHTSLFSSTIIGADLKRLLLVFNRGVYVHKLQF